MPDESQRLPSDMVWEDPPPTNRGAGPGLRDPRRIAMKEHPGKWMLWNDDAPDPSMVTHLKREGFEATSRGKGIGQRCRIYARWPEVIPDA